MLMRTVSLRVGLASLRPVGQRLRMREAVTFGRPEADVTIANNCFPVSARSVKIYTKTGDKGTSVTYSGERRPKCDAIFDALGTSDELSSMIGHARSFMRVDQRFHEVEAELRRIQCMLQDLQSSIATPQGAPEGMLEKVKFDPDNIKYLEKRIDAHTERLPPLRNFILPGGGPAGSALQIARCIARRAERRLIELTEQEPTEEAARIFLNRLSDYLFTAARVSSQIEGGVELIYK